MSVPTGIGNYPPGVTDNDAWFDSDQDSDFDEEPDEYEEAMGNCHGWHEDQTGPFVCGAVGSEDCDECPFHRDLGMTPEELEERDNEEMCEALRHEEWLKLRKFAP